MAGRPKKAGARKPCGRLRPVDDIGHDATLAHRAEIVGEQNKRDHRAGYPLGALYLRGDLADPDIKPGTESHREQSTDRHDAGLEFAAVAHVVRRAWGVPLPTAKSHLAPIIARLLGADAGKSEISESTIARCAEKYGTMIASVRRIPGSQVNDNQRFLLMDRIVMAEVFYCTAAELDVLRSILAALVDLKKAPNR